MELRYTAIVLKKREVGETDRLYTFFTREGGKVMALAKGVRKPTAKLAAALENLTLVDLTLVGGRGWAKVAGAVAEDTYPVLRRSPEYVALALVELGRFDRLVGEGERDPGLFDLLVTYLQMLVRAAVKNDWERGQMLSAGFFFQLARHLGYGNELYRCVLCGQPVRESEALTLSGEAGGILHAAHETTGAVVVSPVLVKLLRLFAETPLSGLEKVIVGARPAREVGSLAKQVFLWITP